MQAGVHLQLLVGAVGMERKMNSSVGLGLALEPEMETKVDFSPERGYNLTFKKRILGINALTLSCSPFFRLTGTDSHSD